MITLVEGLKVKNNGELFEVIKVQKNRVIATIRNLNTGKVSTHTSEEFAKNFTCKDGNSIKDENQD